MFNKIDKSYNIYKLYKIYMIYKTYRTYMIYISYLFTINYPRLRRVYIIDFPGSGRYSRMISREESFNTFRVTIAEGR